jgi:two-component system, LytTR family, response regulator
MRREHAMIKALIADDEPPARRKIRDLLAREQDVDIVGEAADGVEAVALIRRAHPDLVFLDIQMPRLDGFGVIAETGVGAAPFVVFVTAFDEHALRAFEVQALDYLLKPFSPTRFREVLARVRRQMAAGLPGDLGDRIERLLGAVQPSPRYLRQVLADKGDERQVLLPLECVDRIIADRNYLRLFSGGVEHLRRGALSDLEQRLDPEQFLRINRSEIVRVKAVAEFQPWFHGDYRVRMKDGTVLTWSRRYRARSNLGL